MTFKVKVTEYSARHIANAVGCSIQTAYEWRSGRRKPPAWLQEILIEEIKSYHPQIKYAAG